MTPLERVTERVTRNGHPDAADTLTPLLSLEEFFEGNDVVGSIGCNLEGPPSPSQFYDLLKSIAAKSQVKDVRVKITMFDDPAWPFSDQIFVMTDASPEEVASWFPQKLRPDEVSEDSFQASQFEPYEVPRGTRPIACWWD
jgi:hypothetical protein